MVPSLTKYHPNNKQEREKKSQLEKECVLFFFYLTSLSIRFQSNQKKLLPGKVQGKSFHLLELPVLHLLEASLFWKNIHKKESSQACDTCKLQ